MQVQHPSEDVNEYHKINSQFEHPLLSKDLNGIKKAPSISEYGGRALSKKESSQPPKRSESYLGRINKFFGFSQEMPSESAPRDESPLKGSPVRILQISPQKSDDKVVKIMPHNFESPKSKKQLSTHRFKCSCEPSSEPYACASSFRWL